MGRGLNVVLAVLAGAMASLGGCQGREQVQAGGRVVGVYKFGSLRAVLPETVTVPMATAAAQAAVREHGYTVESVTDTADRGRVVARSPKSTDFPRLVIGSGLTDDRRTMVELSYQPLGEEQVCREVLDRMLKQLGL